LVVDGTVVEPWRRGAAQGRGFGCEVPGVSEGRSAAEAGGDELGRAGSGFGFYEQFGKPAWQMGYVPFRGKNERNETFMTI
jgi:hypothetical protein